MAKFKVYGRADMRVEYVFDAKDWDASELAILRDPKHPEHADMMADLLSDGILQRDFDIDGWDDLEAAEQEPTP